MYKQEEAKEYNEFKKLEKFYKFYKGDFKSELPNLIDLSNPELNLSKFGISEEEIGGYKIYKFKWPEGVYIIKNYLSIETQIECATKCLNDYIKQPYRTNLFIYDGVYTEADGTKPKEYNKDKYIVNDPSKYFFNKKIRWTNLGFQYDWNNRLYPNQKTIIPDNMKLITQQVIDLLNLGKYTPESVIINFYDKKNYMTGHLDDGEQDQVSPIISFSLGLSCIFLMGDNNKDVKPLEIKLDSGDVFIMSKYARTCYHGVPRIIENSFNSQPFEYQLNCMQKYTQPSLLDVDDETQLPKNNEFNTVNYLKENRLNFNFRQVEISTNNI